MLSCSLLLLFTLAAVSEFAICSVDHSLKPLCSCFLDRIPILSLTLNLPSAIKLCLGIRFPHGEAGGDELLRKDLDCLADGDDGGKGILDGDKGILDGGVLDGD